MSNVFALVTDAVESDKALATWVAQQLEALQHQPQQIRLTVRAGGGKITVQRETPVHGNGS